MDFRLERLTQNPIIRPSDLPGRDGENINGPSLIATPDWLPDRLGRFYLYFGHHNGRYIRLAYADALEGPWRIHGPGTLRLKDAPGCDDHIASPDVHVDHARREIRMYFHGVAKDGAQRTFLAMSRNGLDFKAAGAALSSFYLRVVRWRGAWLGMAKGGFMYLSQTGTEPFRLLSCTPFPASSLDANSPGDVRHVALRLSGDDLQIFFTRIGDRPESILGAHLDLSQPEASWKARDIKLLLSPITSYEGVDEPLAPSNAGAARSRERALRDPAIFEHEGRCYLAYAIAGEAGIALAEMLPATMAVSSGERAPTDPMTYKQTDDRYFTYPIANESMVARPETAKPASLDQECPVKRMFVMGCGRSGTWLLAALMSTFEDTLVYRDESPVEQFEFISTDSAVQVLKRAAWSYRFVEQTPASINIICMIRHPFDVLTSHNPTTDRRFHITPDRWFGEMSALRYLVESRRPGTAIVRYEDLVADPNGVQARLASTFNLTVATSPDTIPERFKASDDAAVAMHGLRNIDRNSVGRYRKNTESMDYLRNTKPRLGPMLEWIAATYDYDIRL